MDNQQKINMLALAESSDDSIGDDSSLDSFQEEENDDINKKFPKKDIVLDKVPTLEELQWKHNKYIQYKRKLNQEGIKEDEKKSLWSTIYHTFFNTINNKSTVTLNEIELRCKFLFNMDKVEKQKKERSKSAPEKKIIPYTNLSAFMKYFSELDYEKDLRHKKAKKSTNEKMDNNFENLDDPEVLEKKKKKVYNILDLYDITDPTEIVELINRDKAKGTGKGTYLNNIINNKHAYQTALENFKFDSGENDQKISHIFETYLNFDTVEPFFIKNIDVDLVDKYEGAMEDQKRLGAQIDNLCKNVISKIDNNQKLDF